MTSDTNANSFVVFSLDHGDAIATVVAALEPLGIPITVVGRGSHFRRGPTAVLRVPQGRVAETILALELQGYADVVAYQIDEEDGGDGGGSGGSGSNRSS